jgi:hypothetical protein
LTLLVLELRPLGSPPRSQSLLTLRYPISASDCKQTRKDKVALVYRLLVRKPEGKRPLGRPKRRWIDNIKMDLLEIGVNVVDWIGLAQDR